MKMMKNTIRLLICVLALQIALIPLAMAAPAALRKGDSGEGVEALQKELKERGHYTYREITGYFGDNTEEAVKKFQEKKGLNADGVAGKVTLRALLGSKKSEKILDGFGGSDRDDADNTSNTGNTDSLREGAKSEDVEELQDRLKDLGYMSGSQKSTGLYGSITAASVKKFQAGHDLAIDGIAGKKTQGLIYSKSAKKYSKVKSKIADRLADLEDDDSSDIADELCDFAKKYLGKPYVYAANGPNSFDCSGFVLFVMDKFGYGDLERSAQDMGYSFKNRKSRSELKKGDIVFFNTIRDSDLSDHAGIYLGDGNFIHASSGQRKVMISPLDSGYYQDAFSWGGRVI